MKYVYSFLFGCISSPGLYQIIIYDNVIKSQYLPIYFTYIYYSEKKCICSEDLLPKKASILLGIQFDDTKYQELKTHLEKIRIARNLVSSENWCHKYDKNYSVAINQSKY